MYHDEELFYYAGRWYTESDHDDWERYFDNIFHQFYDDNQETEKPIEKEITLSVSLNTLMLLE